MKRATLLSNELHSANNWVFSLFATNLQRRCIFYITSKFGNFSVITDFIIKFICFKKTGHKINPWETLLTSIHLEHYQDKTSFSS